MSPATVTDLTPRRLTRSIEQALSAVPTGLPLFTLLHDAARREAAAGRPAPSLRDVLAQVGTLIAQGRADERQGRIVLRADAPATRVA